MNVLTSAKAQVGNGLFITLDPRTRRLILPGDTRVLLTDTVGFIRNLPHHLVLAFSATLEEVQEADGFCHVVDVSEEDPEERMETVWGVLEELGVSTTPSITVFNKIDKVDQGTVQRLLRRFPQSVAISCTQGTGVPKLIKALSEFPPVKARSLQRGLSSQGAIF
jgi:GTP-binding protein HflX